MTTTYDPSLTAALGDVAVPGTDLTLAELDALRFDDAGALKIRLPFPCRSLWPELERALRDAAAASGETLSESLDVALDMPVFGVQRRLKPLPGLRNIIAVASGKGGVGKSTTAANVALALAAEGARVGLLDADIYGPSMPRLMGLVGAQPEAADEKTLKPLVAHGIEVMSIGFLVDETAPTVWRGPMVTSALNQLLRQTRWGDLDVLVVDMPPGTGDIQLTLSQTVPVAGAVIVTTPQDLALTDARKGLEMFRKVSVPVLGIIENMSVYVCPACGDRTSLFGEGGGERLAVEAGTRLLGELPLALDIRKAADSGRPSVVSDPDGAAAHAYRAIAIAAGAALAAGRRDSSHVFPEIVVEDT
ncbi:MAG: iron-sulfur cluster carrier protein ApbC [Pseudomonadota bacterium]